LFWATDPIGRRNAKDFASGLIFLSDLLDGENYIEKFHHHFFFRSGLIVMGDLHRKKKGKGLIVIGDLPKKRSHCNE
jgi:hypothetical protein